MTAGDLSTVVGRNHVVVTGREDAPVVMFAHGFGCDQSMWHRVLPAFTADYRAVLFDHVGAGRSDLAAYDAEKYSTLDGYVGDILEVGAALDLHDVVLVGHSVGAMMALLAAVAEPTRFRRLVLVSPSPCYIDDADHDYVGGLTREDVDGLLESLDNNYFGWAAMLAPQVMGNPEHPELGEELTESFCRTSPEIAHDFARVAFLSDIRASLGQVTVPALVVQSSEDALVPVGVGRYLHRHLAGSSFVQLAAKGHCPHVSAPEETAAAILGYLTPPR